MNFSEELIKAFGSKANSIPVDDEDLNELKEEFSENFINLWKEDGFCSYGNGIFWTVDPDLVTPLLPKIDLLPEGYKVFARDAFANLFLLSGDEVFLLNVHYDDINIIAIETDFFFDFEIASKSFQKKYLENKKFEAVRKKLGDLGIGECYAYALPLALGGDESVNNTIKVKFLERLAILTQLNET